MPSGRIVVCKSCERERRHHARGLCKSCYVREYCPSAKHPPGTGQINLRTCQEEWSIVKVLAKKHNVSATEIVRRFITWGLESGIKI